VWIEIFLYAAKKTHLFVAPPKGGAWIETHKFLEGKPPLLLGADNPLEKDRSPNRGAVFLIHSV
jgi:hypothetical protein